MNKMKIEDPQNYIFASAVTKDSKTGFLSNRRLLVVKGGHLYYYSNIPKMFDGNPNSIAYHHELPKSSIDIINIKKIKAFQTTSCSFEIVFQETFMMEREDIRKTLTIENYNFAPKEKKDDVVWHFTCDNYFIKQKWVNCLNQLKDYYIKESAAMESYFNNIDSKSETISMNSNLSAKNGKTPWRESTVDRKQYSIADFKSMADLKGTQNDDDLFGQQKFKKKKQNTRLSNTYTEAPQLEDFQMEYEDLHKTEPGFGKEIKMKKLASVQPSSDLH